MPGAWLTGSLDVGHGAQSVGAVKFTAVELLTSGGVGGDKLHWFVGSDSLSKSGVLGVDFGFGGSVPDLSWFRLRVSGIIERSVRMIGRCRMHGLYMHLRQHLSHK